MYKELYNLTFEELVKMLNTKDIKLIYKIFEVMDKKYNKQFKEFLRKI